MGELAPSSGFRHGTFLFLLPTLPHTQRPHELVCGHHSLNTPSLSTCPAINCTLAPLCAGQSHFGESVLPCLLWSWSLASYLRPLNPFAAAANHRGWDGRGLRVLQQLGPQALACHSAAWGPAVPALSLAPGLAEGAGRQLLPRQMKHQARKRSIELLLQATNERGY